jgi:hypothetical protein
MGFRPQAFYHSNATIGLAAQESELVSPHPPTQVKGMTRAATTALLTLGLLVAACALPPTPYQPADGARYGYSEEQIDAETWRVRFAGNSVTDRAVVEDYVLYRAAELAVAQGTDGFVVLKEEVEKDVAYYGSYYPPYPYGAYRFGHGRHYSYYGAGGFGTSTMRSERRYTDHLRIRLFRQIAPEGLGAAYDAQAILRVLAPKIVRPLPDQG